MEAIEKLFEDFARDFDDGTFTSQLDTMILPTTMYVADVTYFIPDRAALAENFKIYRSNLIEQGFARIEAEILDITCKYKGTKQVTLNWNYFNIEGKQFDQTTLVYFCMHDGEGWKITLIETTERLEAKASRGLRQS